MKESGDTGGKKRNNLKWLISQGSGLEIRGGADGNHGINWIVHSCQIAFLIRWE